MKNLKEGLRWIAQAEADLKTAKDCLDDGNYYASAFFFQQSAEKAIKGFLYSKGFRALVTHSVVELLREAAKSARSFEELIDYGKELDRHYIGSRYPNFYPADCWKKKAMLDLLSDPDQGLKLREGIQERRKHSLKRVQKGERGITSGGSGAGCWGQARGLRVLILGLW